MPCKERRERQSTNQYYKGAALFFTEPILPHLPLKPFRREFTQCTPALKRRVDLPILWLWLWTTIQHLRLI